MQQVSIVWFRNDLRLDDHPAINAAIRTGLPILALYIYTEEHRPMGGATKWWLDKSLTCLSDAIEQAGGQLSVVDARGRTVQRVFETLMDQFEVKSVFWNRRYHPAGRQTDEGLKAFLKSRQIDVSSFNGNLLVEPWNLKTQNGDHYRVFTPFWRALKAVYSETPQNMAPGWNFVSAGDVTINSLRLHPDKPDWSAGLTQTWTPGEQGAIERLNEFLEKRLIGYASLRDRPDKQGTSGLSPHLAFGEISPRRVWQSTLSMMNERPETENDGWAFLREIGWRDFSYSLLFQSEDLANKNWNPRFDAFFWENDDSRLRAWQKGLTGYPIVDAGMRQLWTTGWMHNRVRMIVASFLVKHLRIDWRRGEEWFWDTLVDADSANNPASWQWVAGSGADAAPYFRIFNPITQAEKFDPDGRYVRKWVPELAKLPLPYLSAPWAAPPDILQHAGVRLGQSYPKPIVDHKTAREAALRAYELTKSVEQVE